MTEYLIKSSLALSAAYLIYSVFARKITNFIWLRFYFLAIILSSLVFPGLKYLPSLEQKQLVSIPADHLPVFIAEEFITSEAIEIPQSSSIPSGKTDKKVTVSQMLSFIYATGILFFFFRFILGLIQLAYLRFRYGVHRKYGLALIEIPDLRSPFSFFHFIFIQPGDNDQDRKTMLQHEKAHIDQRHSIDLLLLEILCIIQWFNPFVWLIRRKLKEIHEFLADEVIIKETISPVDYQLLLLRQAIGQKLIIPVNGFNSSITKKRILMIIKNKRNKKWIGMAILLIVSILITDALTRVNVAQKTTNPEKINKSTLRKDTVNTQNSKIYKTIKFKPPYSGKEISEPRFKGTKLKSEAAIQDYISRRFNYPANYSSLQQGIVRIKFTVTESGKITNVQKDNSTTKGYYPSSYQMIMIKFSPTQSVYVFESTKIYTETNEPSLVSEAIRLVSSMPDFEPARDKNGTPVRKEVTTTVKFTENAISKYFSKVKNYLDKNLIYPEQAKNSKSQGTVIVSFDIGKNGDIGNLALVPDRDVKGFERELMSPSNDPTLQEAVLKVFQKIPGYKEKLNTSDLICHARIGVMFHLIQSK